MIFHAMEMRSCHEDKQVYRRANCDIANSLPTKAPTLVTMSPAVLKDLPSKASSKSVPL